MTSERARRKTAVVRVGMTHREAWAAVRAAWPGLDFLLYRNTAGYHRDGSRHPDTDTALTDTLAPAGRLFTGPPPWRPPSRRALGAVRLGGTTTFDVLCEQVFGTFGLLPEVTYDLYEHRRASDRPDHATLAALQAEADKQRKAFLAHSDREPTPTDRLYQDGWYGYGVSG